MEDFEFAYANDLQTIHADTYDSLREELLAEMWQDMRFDDEGDYDYDSLSDEEFYEDLRG